MTAKERAQYLVDKFRTFARNTSYWGEYDEGLETQMASNCARIAVDEILEIIRSFASINKLDYDYWINVKKEIDLL